MRRLPTLLLALVFVAASTSAADSERRPTRAALQRALAQYERSTVHVRGPRGSGPGILVGADGHVLTSVRYVSLEAARLRIQDQELPGSVVFADAALKVAVVTAPEGSYAAAPVDVPSKGPVGLWLIGVLGSPGRKGYGPVAARSRRAPPPFLDIDLALPPGSPLFDVQGRLIAVSVERRGRGCRALPLGVVRRKLAQAPNAAAP